MARKIHPKPGLHQILLFLSSDPVGVRLQCERGGEHLALELRQTTRCFGRVLPTDDAGRQANLPAHSYRVGTTLTLCIAGWFDWVLFGIM